MRQVIDASFAHEWYFPGGITPDRWSTEVGLRNPGRAFDLGVITLPNGVMPDGAELEFRWESLPNLAEGSVVTITVEDSSDAVTYAVTGFSKRLVGQAGGGYPAGRIGWPLATLRQYVRVHVYAGDLGDNTAQLWRFSIVF
jgi:hypothetical protein